uniref:Toprim domain-containing protein n=1 Tax=Aliivibrio wodanis TaxID=80852 RepID=A0A5Q4ZYT8_9GAMM|nr:hypothetical protein [Aliivibrio wodanis]VVV07033.1 hypothetical protein AW0309160_04527 [Aliivibrio wodanis]
MNEIKHDTIDTLSKVLQGSRDDLNIPSALDSSKTIRLPYVGDKGKFTEYYGMTFGQLGGRVEQLKVPPQIPMLKNIANAALRYSASAMLPVNHSFHNEVRRLHSSLISINKSERSKQEKITDKNKALVKINKAYSNRFSKKNPNNEYKKTRELAEQLVNESINELERLDQLGVYSRSDALKLANGYLSIFESNVIVKSTSDVEKLLIQEFLYSEDSQVAFLKKKFNSDNPHVYLKMLLEQNISVFDSAAKEANIDADAMIDLIELSENDSPVDNLATSISKKAALNAKKSVRGAFNAYIKNDQKNSRFKNVLLNVHIWKGGKKEIESFYFYPSFENANDPHSRNEYTDFLKEGNVPNVVFNEKSVQEFQQREADRSIKRQQILHEIELENIEKLASAKNNYLQQTPVTSQEQLKSTYWEQKGLVVEAAQHLTGLRIDSNGTTWLPLDQSLNEERDISTTTGYQKIYAEKIEIKRDGEESEYLNKMFDGLGDGTKKQAFYTIGNPSEASIIITNEGIANGLHAYVESKKRGLNALVICAIDAGNINHAIRAALNKYPTLPIINMADNDRFNKHGQERFAPAISYTDLTTKEVVRLENTGLKVAKDFKDAIELASVFVDFSDINGKDFTKEQQENKLSDIDDLIHTLENHYRSEGDSNEIARDKARNEAGDYLLHAITTTLQTSVSPNWNIENQYKYKWIPTDINLNKEQFQNFYDIKDSLIHAYDFFKASNSQHLDYQTYSQVIKTGREMNLIFNDSSPSTQKAQKPAQKVETNLVSIQEIPLVEMHGQLPLTQLYENKEVLQEQIYDLENRIDNLALSSSDKAQDKIANYELKLNSLTQELKVLQDQIAKVEPEKVTKATLKVESDDFVQKMSEAFSIPKEIHDLKNKLSIFNESIVKNELNETDLSLKQTAIELNLILLDINQEPTIEHDINDTKLIDLNLRNIALAQNIIDSYLTMDSDLQESVQADAALISSAIDEEINKVNNIAIASSTKKTETEQSAVVETPEPELAEEIQPQVEAEQPDVVEATEPEATEETQPKAETEQPDVVEATEHEATEETQPETKTEQPAVAETTEPELAAETQPQAETEQPAVVETAEPELAAETQPQAETEQPAVVETAEPELTEETQPKAETEQPDVVEATEPELAEETQPQAETEQPDMVETTEPELAEETQPQAEAEQSAVVETAEPELAEETQPQAEAEQSAVVETAEPELAEETQPQAETEQPAVAETTEPEATEETQPKAETEQPDVVEATEPELAEETQPQAETEQPDMVETTEPELAEETQLQAEAEQSAVVETAEPELAEETQPQAEAEQSAVVETAEPELAEETQPQAETEQPAVAETTEPKAETEQPDVVEATEPELAEETQPQAETEQPDMVETTEPELAEETQLQAEAEQSAVVETAEPELAEETQPQAEAEQSAVVETAEPEATEEAQPQAETEQPDMVEATKATMENIDKKQFIIHKDWSFASTAPDSFQATMSTNHFQQNEINIIKKLQHDLSEIKNQLNVIQKIKQNSPVKPSDKSTISENKSNQTQIPQKRSAQELQRLFTPAQSTDIVMEQNSQIKHSLETEEQPTINEEKTLTELISKLNNDLLASYKEDEIHNVKFKQLDNVLKENLKAIIDKAFMEHDVKSITEQHKLVESINTIARQSNLNRGVLISSTMSHALSNSTSNTSSYAIRNVIFDNLSFSNDGPLTNASIEHINGNMSLEEYVELAELTLPEKEFSAAFASDLDRINRHKEDNQIENNSSINIPSKESQIETNIGLN